MITTQRIFIQSHSLLLKRMCSVLNSQGKTTQEQTSTNLNAAAEINWANAKPYDSIPGPKPLPIIGNLWRFIPYIGTYGNIERHKMFVSQQETYGDIFLLKGLGFQNDFVVCCNPKDIEKVYRNEGQWPKRNFLHSIKHYRLHTRPDIFQGYGGIFTADGPEWQHARSIVNPVLMKPRTVKFYVEPIDEVAKDFVKRIRYLAEQNPVGEMPEDFCFELNKWSLESICILALDKRLGLLNKDYDPNSETGIYIKNVLNLFDYIAALDIEPSLWKYISTPTWRKYVKTMDDIVVFIQKHVEDGRSKIQKNKSENDMTILEQLLKKGWKYAFGTMVDMLIAGVDSTSKSVAAILYYLAVNQEVQDKLRKEIISVLPTLDTSLTSEKLEQMHYLKAVIKESMRLAPISIGNIRNTPVNLVLSGYQVPKGTSIVTSSLALCHKDEYFPDAHKFLPERWLRKDGNKLDYNPWIYQPFGVGPRSCIGKRLANLEIEVLLAQVIRNFKMEWCHGEMKFKLGLIYSIASPLKIKMLPVDNN